MIVSSLVVLFFASQQSPSVSQDVGPKQVGSVSLQLDCHQSSGIRFTLANSGGVDTTLSFGAVLANGGKYLVVDLRLTVQAPGEPAEVFRYSPRDYPAGIAGSLGEWLQPLPARSEFGISAKTEDFLSKMRPEGFRRGSQLRVTLLVPQPHKEAMLLKFWSGTLTSNVCVMD